MNSSFLIYGANGFVGSEIARKAVQSGLHPVLAGRNADSIKALAEELRVDYRIFDLEDDGGVEQGLDGMAAVLHCAGPYIYTAKPMADACLRTGTHYLDITGEIPVYAALKAKDAEAIDRNVMLLPGVGFDVAPTDCLAVYLKHRLPAATRLSLAFQGRGPAGAPRGTVKTTIEMAQFKGKYRQNGRLVDIPLRGKSRWIDFSKGPRRAYMVGWGDVFMAFYSTGIPNIENYMAMNPGFARVYRFASLLRPIFHWKFIRKRLQEAVPGGSTPEQRAKTRTHVWGEVEDGQGRKAAARLHGPEAGVEWTSITAIGAIWQVLEGNFRPGFQTPGRVFGADFVLTGEGVTREDL